MRAALIIFCLVFSAWAAYFAQPYVGGNSEVSVILVTVFTVFAGFLVAIVTILGDPSLIPGESWKIAEMRRENIELRLISHMWLFFFYLAAIAFLVAAAILEKIPPTIVANGVKVWISRLYLFFGFSSFLFTFGLAKSIFAIQLARIDAEIERRRRAVGLGSGNTSKHEE